MSNKNVWQTLSSKYLLENPWFKIRQDEVLKPDGKQGVYNILEGRDTALIIPKIDDTYYLVEQFRYPVQKKSIEFPMGGMEENEDIADTLKRELLEEVGFVASKFTKLGSLYQANGFNTIASHIYLAENCMQSEKHLDASEQDMVTITLRLKEIKDYISSGKIHDGPTVGAFALYLLYLENQKMVGN